MPLSLKEVRDAWELSVGFNQPVASNSALFSIGSSARASNLEDSTSFPGATAVAVRKQEWCPIARAIFTARPITVAPTDGEQFLSLNTPGMAGPRKSSTTSKEATMDSIRQEIS